jgi:hypothetical protein
MQNQKLNSPTLKRKWATFTYAGKKTTYITNIFTHSDIRIAYRTNNTIHNFLTHKAQYFDKFSSSGVYKLTCPDCKKAYIGQTGRNFTKRYNEHKHAFQNNTHSSKFTHHLNKHIHFFGAINDIMQILHNQKKGPNLNTIECCYIHTEATFNNHLNENQTIYLNRIFDTILKFYHP